MDTSSVDQMKAEKDVEGLIKALKDEDKDVREAAAEALGEIGDARAVEPLIEALKDGAIFVQSSAATALGKIGDARASTASDRVLRATDTLIAWSPELPQAIPYWYLININLRLIRKLIRRGFLFSALMG